MNIELNRVRVYRALLFKVFEFLVFFFDFVNDVYTLATSISFIYGFVLYFLQKGYYFVENKNSFNTTLVDQKRKRFF